MPLSTTTTTASSAMTAAPEATKSTEVANTMTRTRKGMTLPNFWIHISQGDNADFTHDTVKTQGPRWGKQRHTKGPRLGTLGMTQFSFIL